MDVGQEGTGLENEGTSLIHSRQQSLQKSLQRLRRIMIEYGHGLRSDTCSYDRKHFTGFTDIHLIVVYIVQIIELHSEIFGCIMLDNSSDISIGWTKLRRFHKLVADHQKQKDHDYTPKFLHYPI